MIIYDFIAEERNSMSLSCEAIDSSLEDTDLMICRTGVIFCFLDIMLSHLLARCAMKAAKVGADYSFFGAHGVVFYLVSAPDFSATAVCARFFDFFAVIRQMIVEIHRAHFFAAKLALYHSLWTGRLVARHPAAHEPHVAVFAGDLNARARVLVRIESCYSTGPRAGTDIVASRRLEAREELGLSSVLGELALGQRGAQLRDRHSPRGARRLVLVVGVRAADP